MPAVGNRKQGKKTRLTGRHPARNTTSRRAKSKPKRSRGRKVDWRTRMRRRFADWFVRFDESRGLIQTGAFCLALVVLYVFWALGGFARVGAAVDSQSRKLFVASGFSIEQVQVEGRNKTEVSSVEQALAIDAGSSILHFDTEAARERLMQLDWVDEAQVIRFLPSTVHVVLVERAPVAIWQLNKQLYLVDRTGFVVGIADLTSPPNLPLVVGAGAAESAAELLDLLEQYPALAESVEASIRVGDRRWRLKLKNGVDIHLPAEQPELALQKLVEYDSQYNLMGQSIVAIDLRLADRIYLKLSDEEAARLWEPGLPS